MYNNIEFYKSSTLAVNRDNNSQIIHLPGYTHKKIKKHTHTHTQLAIMSSNEQKLFSICLVLACMFYLDQLESAPSHHKSRCRFVYS